MWQARPPRGRHLSIRSRLLLSSVLMVLGLALAFLLVSSLIGFSRGRQQAIDRLGSVAALKEAELETWAQSLQDDLAVALIGTETLDNARDILSADATAGERQRAYEQLHERFDLLVDARRNLDELFLMDLERRVVLSTSADREGHLGAPDSQVYFREGLKGEYLHRPSYYTLSLGQIAIVAVRPVHDREGRAVGVLVGRAGPTVLNEIMLERTGLGETGETYLVTRSHILLTKPRFPQERWGHMVHVFSAGVDAAVTGQSGGSAVYANYQGVRVIGVYRWLSSLQTVLLAEQAEAEAMGATYAMLAVNGVVAVVAGLLAGALSLSLARSITRPLGGLVEMAARVAEGDLEQTAPVVRADEIGVLARAFNVMTARLHDLVGSLEERVSERTRSLQRRALQLEASSRVSREVTSLLDAEDLLNRVVELIRDLFGYYWVGIFLVDAESQALQFAAGTGEAGEWWRREGMRLGLGPGSLNGEAARLGRALVVNDALHDPRFRAHASLAATRAEVVVPLRLGDETIGTLDVQSTEPQAFREDDAGILQNLADQVAIAIENAHLYERSRRLAVLEERNRLARELHDSVIQSLYSLALLAGGWRRQAEEAGRADAAGQLDEVAWIARQALKEMRLLVHELRPPVLEQEGLVGALHLRLDAVERRAGVDARLLAEDLVQLPAPVEEGLYRIAQEALNNALKHAAATAVRVTLRLRDGHLELEVTDNGRGFDPVEAASCGGVGIGSMRQRAEELGGWLSIRSQVGSGTSVTVGVRTAAGMQHFV